MACRHYSVTGRVQGVFYRASTRDEAQRLGLTGWVRNCFDGRVELLACGDSTALSQLERWLHQGPPLAQVDMVESIPAEAPGLNRFEIRYSSD